MILEALIAFPFAKQMAFAGAPTSVGLADGSAVVRRIIDSDNSCLFNAVGYVMEHSRKASARLRSGPPRIHTPKMHFLPHFETLARPAEIG